MGFTPKTGLFAAIIAAAFGLIAWYAYITLSPPQVEPEKDDLSQAAFRVGSIYKPTSLHPYDGAYSPTIAPLYNNLTSVTVKKGESNIYEITDDLLESLDVTNGGREAVAHIRKNVYFHNGAVLKAHDVVYTFKKYLPQMLARWPLYSPKDFRFEEKDNFSVKCVCSKPVDWRILFFIKQILNAEYERSWIGKDLADYIPMGTGPYRYTSYDKATGLLKLERFKKYWGGEPAIGYFHFIPYENTDAAMLAIIENRIDYFQGISPEDMDYVGTRTTNAVSQEELPGLTSYSLVFNTQNPKYSDWRLRRGISRLINRKEIVGDRFALNFTGVMADVPLHVTYPQTKPTVEPYEPLKGKKLIEEAGYVRKDGWYQKDGKRLEVEVLLAKYNAGYMHVLRLLQRQLGLAGVLINVKKVAEWSELDRRVKKRDFEAAFVEINDLLSLNIAYSYFMKNNPDNYSGYSDDVLDDLFIKAQSAQADEKLKTAIQARIREKAPMITLFYKKIVMAVNRKYLGEWFYKDPYTLSYIYEAGKKEAPKQ